MMGEPCTTSRSRCAVLFRSVLGDHHSLCSFDSLGLTEISYACPPETQRQIKPTRAHHAAGLQRVGILWHSLRYVTESADLERLGSQKPRNGSEPDRDMHQEPQMMWKQVEDWSFFFNARAKANREGPPSDLWECDCGRRSGPSERQSPAQL